MPAPMRERFLQSLLRPIAYWRGRVGSTGEELQFEVALAAVEGLSVTLIAKAARVARSTVYAWQRRYRDDIAARFVPGVGYLTDNQLRELGLGSDEARDLKQLVLAATPERLNMIRQWRLDRIAVLADELEFVERQLQEGVVFAAADGIPRARLAKAAGVARSTVYAWQRRYNGQVLVRVSEGMSWFTDHQISEMYGRLVRDGDAQPLLQSLGDDFLADLDPARIKRAVVHYHFRGFEPSRRRMP